MRHHPDHDLRLQLIITAMLVALGCSSVYVAYWCGWTDALAHLDRPEDTP